MINLEMRPRALAAMVSLLAIAPETWGQEGGGTWNDAFVGIYSKK